MPSDSSVPAAVGSLPVADGARSASGLCLPETAGPEHVAKGLEERLGEPGAYPYTRGVRSSSYRTRPWTIRQLAGFSSASATNERYRLLLDRGATGINGVFDYPSLRAVGSDDPRAQPDVGRGGVAVDVVDDFDDLFRDIPLGDVSVSLVSSQPIGAVPHLAMYLQVANRRGVAWDRLAGTSQNDFLMETAITIAPKALAPASSFRLECDLVEFASEHLPRWNPVSVTGYNYREAGADAPLEMALSLAHAQAVVRELLARGRPPSSFLPRLSFFLCAHSDFFEEVAKYRAIRRMWSRWVRDDLGVTDPRCQQLRFHTQTSGASNVAKFAHVNIARSAVQALGAIMGGTQSLHVNGYDEALSIPTEHAALTALRTQYMLLYETGVADVVDPLGGSWLVESMTDQIEERAQDVLAEIDALGGAVAVTESGWVHAELGGHAFAQQAALEGGQRLVVGLNTQMDGHDESPAPFVLPNDMAEVQRARIDRARDQRDAVEVARALTELDDRARSGENIMQAALEAAAANVTLGEFGDTVRAALGTWEFPL